MICIISCKQLHLLCLLWIWCNSIEGNDSNSSLVVVIPSVIRAECKWHWIQLFKDKKRLLPFFYLCCCLVFIFFLCCCCVFFLLVFRFLYHDNKIQTQIDAWCVLQCSYLHDGLRCGGMHQCLWLLAKLHKVMPPWWWYQMACFFACSVMEQKKSPI